MILDSGSSSEGIDRALSAFIKSEKNEFRERLGRVNTIGSQCSVHWLIWYSVGNYSIIFVFGKPRAQQVISGVSQALVATAVGLIVAIPAVVAYNIFAKKIKILLLQLESFRDLYISQLRKAEVIAGAKVLQQVFRQDFFYIDKSV